jgi:hypothetical protein
MSCVCTAQILCYYISLEIFQNFYIGNLLLEEGRKQVFMSNLIMECVSCKNVEVLDTSDSVSRRGWSYDVTSTDVTVQSKLVVAMKDWLHYPAFCGAASTLRIMKKLLIPGGEYTSKRSVSASNWKREKVTSMGENDLCKKGRSLKKDRCYHISSWCLLSTSRKTWSWIWVH